MNFSLGTVASWYGYSKTIPKRRSRRRVGVCCPIPRAHQGGRPPTKPRSARGVQRTEVGSSHRLPVALHAPRPTSVGPSTSRHSGGSKLECSRRWSTTYAYFCGFLKAAHPIRGRPYSTLAACTQPLRAALGAATTEPSARKARKYMRRWTL